MVAMAALLALACTLPGAPLGSQSARGRPLTLGDLLAMQTIYEVVPSPDGEWFAVTIVRGRTGNEIYGQPDLFGASRADIWIVPRRGGEARNITHGARDGAGYWNPVWSPDSRRMAVLSTAGGDNIRLYVLDRTGGTVRRLAEDGIDVEMNAGGVSFLSRVAAAWTSDTTLLCSLLPPGELPRFFTRGVAFAPMALREWNRMRRGAEPTASVLESGVTVGRPSRRLVSIDVESGKTELLAEGAFASATLSPDRGSVLLTEDTAAFLPAVDEPIAYPPNNNVYQHVMLMHRRVGLLSLGSRDAGVRWIVGSADPQVNHAAFGPVWSADGSAVAWLAGNLEAQSGGASFAMLLAIGSGSKAVRLGGRGFRATRLAWAGSELLVRGRMDAAPTASPGGEREEWWIVDAGAPEAPPRPITTRLAAVPALLWGTGAPHGVAGVADGRLWEIDTRSGNATDITPASVSAIEGVSWPSALELARGRVAEVVVSARGSGEGESHRVRITGGSAVAQKLIAPAPEAKLAAFAPATRTAVFERHGPDGTFLWTTDARREGAHDGAPRLALNEYMAEIAEGKHSVVEYSGDGGQRLWATLILPLDYEEGKRYPLVVEVYAGHRVASEPRSPGSAKEYPNPQHNRQLLAARGYAVLIPSLPMPSGTAAADPFFEMARNALPAVDRVVDLGIADPDRLALVGHSYGGYAALSILAQTRRFKAAVISAVHSDLLRYHHSFRVTHRYYPFAEDLRQYIMAGLEAPTATLRLGASPWRDYLRYIRNSPVFHLDRIETPILLMHGELDGVPIQQAEEVFMGLHRMGGRVRFVRYWGEAHNLDSPANLRDKWSRTFEWLDEYLGVD